MASKPTIVVIPGSFSIVSMYHPLQDTLNEQGYEVYVNQLPSSSRNAPEEPASLSDDAEFSSNIIAKVVAQGKDVVVLGHSYGGVVASMAARGLSKADRNAKGLEGGVVRIIYLTAIVLVEGQSVFGDQGKPPESMVETDKFGFMRLINPEFTASRMYDVWSEEKGLQWARAAPRQSALSFDSPQAYAAYKEIPSSYILCEDDGIVPLEKQKQYLNNIKVATGKEVDTHRLRSGHVPNLTATDAVTKLIIDIVSA